MENSDTEALHSVGCRNDAATKTFLATVCLCVYAGAACISRYVFFWLEAPKAVELSLGLAH